MILRVGYSSNWLDGLFNYLFHKYSEQEIKNFINVSASSTYFLRGDPFVTINPLVDKSDYNDLWISSNRENSSIQISFLKYQFIIDSYTLQRRINNDNNCPIEWLLEGSKDLIGWTTIHHKHRGMELMNETTNFAHHWECKQKEYYKSFRFTMLGENLHKDEPGERFCFGLGTIELFGTLSGTIFHSHMQIHVKDSFLFYTILLCIN